MFYFDNYCGNKILKSDYLNEITAFFTTRNFDLKALGETKIIRPEQTHSNNVEFVKEKVFEYKNTDGLILKNSTSVICLKFADCTPLMFYNPITKTGAIAHAGWRGTAAKIGVKTLEKMGGNPNDTIAVIGPAIGKCCYEVSDDVKEQLMATVINQSGLSNGNNVDLKAINAQQLRESGVTKIDICPYCTSCNNDLFYSYRKENGTADRHYAIMQLC